MCSKEIYDAKKDPVYQKPVITEEKVEYREIPDGRTVPYHYIHGYFEGTKVKFLFCIPRKDAFAWRFYQHLSPFPGPDEELASLTRTGEDDMIAFAITHGAAYVESNMGSEAIFSSNEDPSIFFKSNAAVAEYCREKIRQMYGPHRVYGYCFGGSGGGYKTMSCMENTNAYDGGLAFVIGSPVSLPNCLTVMAHGARLLRHCWQKVAENMEPWGSQDPFMGLNDEEAEALREIMRMGFPPRCTSYLEFQDDGSLPVLAPTVHAIDEPYFKDYWEKEGYLGAIPGGNARRDRIKMTTNVVRVLFGETGEEARELDDRNGTDDAWQKMMMGAGDAMIEVEKVPEGEDLFLRGVDISVKSGRASGRKLHLAAIDGNALVIGMSYGADDPAEVLALLQPGDELLLDNSDYIALGTWHRHQVPSDRSFYCFDQYRDSDGKPIYPQRDTVISFGFTAQGCGSVQDGHVQGKMIIMNNLMDGDFPWQADWYKELIYRVNGEAGKDCVRLYYNDNAPHGDVTEGGDPKRVVSYLGMLRQGLLELSAWAEGKGEPAEESHYDLADSQISLKATADERGGLQPLVSLRADGKYAVRVKAGESVTFHADIALPAGAGNLEDIEWNLMGTEFVRYGKEADTITYAFDTPGTYVVVVRVTSNRNEGDIYTRLRNLARVKVTVEEGEI